MLPHAALGPYYAFWSLMQLPQPPQDGSVSASSVSFSCMASWQRTRFPLSQTGFKKELRFQLVFANCSLYRICSKGVYVVKTKQNKKSAFFLEYVTVSPAIKSVFMCFHHSLMKCIWSSHTTPTPPPDFPLFHALLLAPDAASHTPKVFRVLKVYVLTVCTCVVPSACVFVREEKNKTKRKTAICKSVWKLGEWECLYARSWR